jgi:hypothetical protein
MRQRPDSPARREQAAAARDFAREPRYRWLPTNAQATMSAQSTGTPSGHVDATLSLNAGWTLFDARAHRRRALARGAGRDCRPETRALERTIDAQVWRRRCSPPTSRRLRRARCTAASRKSADETDPVPPGPAKVIELVDANEQRFAAEVNFAVAQFSVASAYLALRQAMGLDPLGGQLP